MLETIRCTNTLFVKVWQTWHLLKWKWHCVGTCDNLTQSLSNQHVPDNQCLTFGTSSINYRAYYEHILKKTAIWTKEQRYPIQCPAIRRTPTNKWRICTARHRWSCFLACKYWMVSCRDKRSINTQIQTCSYVHRKITVNADRCGTGGLVAQNWWPFGEHVLYCSPWLPIQHWINKRCSMPLLTAATLLQWCYKHP